MKVLEINKEDLKTNIDKIKEQAKTTETKIIAVVKGNGYGLGIVDYSKFLLENGIELLAVSTVEEAIKLREAGIKEDILMMSSTCIEEDIKQLIENNIIITLGSEMSIKIADEIAKNLNMEARTHLKIDTGFGRYGFIYNNLGKVVNILKETTNIKIEGTFSHFSQAYAKNEKWTKIQFARFVAAVSYLENNGINPGIVHICNSSAFLKYPNMHLNAVRIGSAFLGRIAVPNSIGLKRIGRLKSQISEVKVIPKGYNIGYSNAFKTKKTTRIAIAPVGYYDGYNVRKHNDSYRVIDKLRYIHNAVKDLFKDKKLKIRIDNKKYRLLGKIGMYHIVIDITGNDKIKIGDEIYLDINPLYIDSSVRREFV